MDPLQNAALKVAPIGICLTVDLSKPNWDATMIDFRQYHQAHEMLINLQRGVLSSESVVGMDHDDPRRVAVGYLAAKMLRSKTGQSRINVLLGKNGTPFLSPESAKRSRVYKSLASGRYQFKSDGIRVESFDIVFMMELGGFGIVVKACERLSSAA